MALPQGPLEHRYQGEHPVRTLAYLFRDDRWRLLVSVLAFIVKHSPVWLLPLVTANIIDIVVEQRPISELGANTLMLLVVLMLNYPTHLLYVRCMHGSVRRVGTALRSALCRRMQELSIGYHARISASALQTKVIRDVENIEVSAQQSADTGLAAVITLLGGSPSSRCGSRRRCRPSCWWCPPPRSWCADCAADCAGTTSTSDARWSNCPPASVR